MGLKSLIIAPGLHILHLITTLIRWVEHLCPTLLSNNVILEGTYMSDFYLVFANEFCYRENTSKYCNISGTY